MRSWFGPSGSKAPACSLVALDHIGEPSLSSYWHPRMAALRGGKFIPFLSSELREKDKYHYETCFIRKVANGCSLAPSPGCLCRHQCSTLIATAASASLNFTLSCPVLCLLWAGQEGDASQQINEGKRTDSLLLSFVRGNFARLSSWRLLWSEWRKQRGRTNFNLQWVYFSPGYTFCLWFYSFVKHF